MVERRLPSVFIEAIIEILICDVIYDENIRYQYKSKKALVIRENG